LLGFAIGVALAALAAAISGPPRPADFAADERPAEHADPGPARRPVTVAFDAGQPRSRRTTVGVGSHVIVRVTVPEPGSVDVEGLGLTESATPMAPAVFDVLTDEPGVQELTFRPTRGTARPVGTLVVRRRSSAETAGRDR
jgi:hypothetical protein